MKQMSDVETTTSSRPALPTVLMALPRESGVRTLRLYHSRCHASTRPPPSNGKKALVRDVVDFYDRRPISEAQVLAALACRRGMAGGPLTADDLFAFDQDHYGGLAAVDTLARLAGAGASTRVLDLCAGLGGPARFLASRRSCQVVALELNAGRAAGTARLTAMVGLQHRVRVVRGDATRLPFRGGRFDACLSQEALLHI